MWWWRIGQRDPFRSGQLLVDGDAESLAGWTVVSGNWQLSNFITPKQGSFFMWPGAVPSAEIYQDVNLSTFSALISSGNAGYEFNGWHADFDNDTQRFVLEFRNASDVIVQIVDSGELDVPTNNTWQEYASSGSVNTAATKCRLRLLGTRNSGSDCDSYFDDMKLEIVEI